MRELLKRLVREEEGQDLIEYALVGSIIMVGSYLIIQAIGARTIVLWQGIQTAIGA